jgi:hypothetical protein
MPQAKVNTGFAFEDAGVALMARVEGWNGVNIVQSDLSAIQYCVTNKNTGATVIASTSLTISSVVFNTLQTPAVWQTDATGYNFRHNVPAAAFPSGDEVTPVIYRVEYKLTFASGEPVFLVWDIEALPIYMS